MWGCFLMSGVKILHFLKDWWKSIPIHQNYTMALTVEDDLILLQHTFPIDPSPSILGTSVQRVYTTEKYM